MRDAVTDLSTCSTRLGRPGAARLTLVLAAAIVALVVVLMVVILNPPTELETSAEGPKYEPADSELAGGGEDEPQSAEGTAAPPVAGAGALRQPTIRFPRTAVNVSAEQLQEEAQRVVASLREDYPETAQALHVAALFASQTRHTSEAEQLWTKCIELDPQQVAYYVNLAAIAMDRGKSQLAADTMQRAVDVGLSNPDVQHHRAVALTKLGRCEEAEEAIQKALAVHPREAAYWMVLGQAQLKLRKAAEAEASLKKSLDLGGGSQALYYALANALANQQKQEEAAKYRALFQQLKDAAGPMDDKQQRYQVLSRAEALRTAMTVMCEAATLYDRTNNSLESERLLMRAVALDPSNPTPYTLLAGLYSRSGMLPETRVVQERLIELTPWNLLNYLVLAKICVELHEPQAAEAALKQALAIQPESLEVIASLAQFYLEQGRLGHARWYATQAVRRQPSSEGYQLLAQICQAMGAEQDAQQALAQAESLRPAGQKPPQ